MKKHLSSNRINALPKLRTWVVAACVGLSTVTSGFAAGGAPMNFWGNYTGAQASRAVVDITKPVTAGRSYFTTKVEEIPGGARLTVEMYNGALNEPVSLSLNAAVNDGKGGVMSLPFMTLSDNVADNPTVYYSKRVFDLQYSDLNAKLKAMLPASVQGNPGMEIGPGSPLFVFGEWHKYGHQWGGIDRGGIFYMPEQPGHQAAAQTTTPGRRTEALDLAYPIPNPMALAYNTFDPQTQTSKGLKLNGQIRSRLESEGKYQVPFQQMKDVKKRLFQLANDPAEAAKVFGPDWAVSAEMRYMKKDPADPTKYLLDKDGMPTPDPMVDTYYDNANFDAARNDIAIRYRWTEGNGTGAWNLKPGIGLVSPEGIADRIEFGLDSTDDKPGTIKKFVDSMDPLNPFKTIREVIPGSTPSDFLQPSVKITDTRFKFKFKHKAGLVFEVSLDEVLAASLRGQGETGSYCQMEADIDHLSTASTNVAAIAPGGGMSLKMWNQYGYSNNQYYKQQMAAWGQDSFLDGRPVMHTVADLDPQSPVKQKHLADFKLANTAIVALRNEVLGAHWTPGPQKYALAAEVLELVKKQDASPSVKKLVAEEHARLAAGAPARTISRKFGSGCAQAVFNP